MSLCDNLSYGNVSLRNIKSAEIFAFHPYHVKTGLKYPCMQARPCVEKCPFATQCFGHISCTQDEKRGPMNPYLINDIVHCEKNQKRTNLKGIVSSTDPLLKSCRFKIDFFGPQRLWWVVSIWNS